MINLSEELDLNEGINNENDKQQQTNSSTRRMKQFLFWLFVDKLRRAPTSCEWKIF